MKNFIGSVLYFDEAGYGSNLNIWKNKVLPCLEQLKEHYNELELDEFSQMLYEELTSKGLAGLKDRYRKALRKEVARLKPKTPLFSKTFADLAIDHDPFGELEADLERLKGVFSTFTGPVEDYNFARYDEKQKRFVLNEEKMKRHFEERIETDSQNQAYNTLLKLKAYYEEADNILNGLSKSGRRISIIPASNEFSEQLLFEENGTVHLDLKHFVTLF
jgi:CHAT domain-containing protein